MASTSANEKQKYEEAARAGWLYYIAGKTQDEIAKQLNISRQSAQRLVSLSISAGLIKVRLEHPVQSCMELSTLMKKRFNLSLCEVVPSEVGAINSTHGLAQAGAAEIERVLKNTSPQVLAFGTGRVLRACADELSHIDCSQHSIVSLVGNIAEDGSASPYDVAIHVADRVKSRHFPMPLPVIANTKSIREAWHNQPHVMKVQDIIANADTSFVGIGSLGSSSPLHIDGFITQDEMNELNQLGAVGEIIGWVFDSNGKQINCQVNQRVTSYPLYSSPTNRIIGIAAGEEKVAAISGALRSGILTGLITNEYTAERLLAC